MPKCTYANVKPCQFMGPDRGCTFGRWCRWVEPNNAKVPAASAMEVLDPEPGVRGFMKTLVALEQASIKVVFDNPVDLVNALSMIDLVRSRIEKEENGE